MPFLHTHTNYANKKLSIEVNSSFHICMQFFAFKMIFFAFLWIIHVRVRVRQAGKGERGGHAANDHGQE